MSFYFFLQQFELHRNSVVLSGFLYLKHLFGVMYKVVEYILYSSFYMHLRVKTGNCKNVL